MTVVKSIWGSVLFFYDENTTTLAEEISKHKNLTGADLTFADLSGADLKGANLGGADLFNANIRNADLSNTNLISARLRGADLTGASLYGASLRDANLMGTNLTGATLIGADLFNTDLMDADLSNADLSKASIKYADLSEAKNVPDGLPMACPTEGSFIAWKKVKEGNHYYIIKLEIPEDAKRSSATSKKCRCDKAKVLEITNLKTGENVDEVVNTAYVLCTYKVGEMVYPDGFDDNRWRECSHGIHFFIDREEAVDYYI